MYSRMNSTAITSEVVSYLRRHGRGYCSGIARATGHHETTIRTVLKKLVQFDHVRVIPMEVETSSANLRTVRKYYMLKEDRWW